MQISEHLQRRWRPAAPLFLFLCLSSTGFSQTIQLRFSEAPLLTVFATVEKQSAYRFVYTKEELADVKPVTLAISSADIGVLLAAIFKGQPLAYSLNKNYISVYRSTAPPEPPRAVVTGRVVSEAGEPIRGATVQVKGTKETTATDDDGRFVLKAATARDVLVISSVGYLEKETGVAGRISVTVPLATAVNVLDETIVIAYGTTTQRTTTGSVSRISAKDIAKQPVSNPLAALQGRIPGLFVTQVSGSPGGSFRVQLRGQNSIQNGTSPLYLIDGVPFLGDGESLIQRAGMDGNHPFHSLNPDNIESIEVLKDADATAIYGSRGANGVVLITTKKGRAGKPVVEVTIYNGWQQVAKLTPFLTTNEYLQMRREAFANDGVVPTTANAPDLLLWDSGRYLNWQKLLIGGGAHLQNYQLRVRGGQGNVSYTTGINYNRETTVFPGDAATYRASLDQSLQFSTANKRFSSLLSASYSYNHSQLLREDLTGYQNLAPNSYAPYDSAGRLVWRENGVSVGNPLAILQQPNIGVTDRVTANWTSSYTVIAGLQIKLSAGYNTVGLQERSYLPIASQDPANNPKGSSRQGQSLVRTWIAEPQFHYIKNFARLKLSIVTGGSLQETVNRSNFAEGQGYTSDDLLQNFAAATTVIARNGSAQYRYSGVFGRVQADYNGQYLFSLTGRRDASSRFGPGRQAANFGSVGAAYVFSKHQWLTTAFPALSFGKLRASYGVTGNDQIGNYQYLDSWTATTYNYQGSPSLRPSRIYNPDYSWEQNRKIEAGLDIGLFKDRLLLSAGCYRNCSDNQIVRYPLPGQTGFQNVLYNFPGEVVNSGWEVVLTAAVVQRTNLEWKVVSNFSLNRNRLRRFPGLELSSYALDYAIGEPLSIRRGYHFQGVDPNTGIYQFEDLNKDGAITTADQQFYGSTQPQYFGGVQNSLRYRHLEVDVFFQFVKQRGIDLRYPGTGYAGSGMINQPRYVLTRWQGSGDETEIGRFTQSSTTAAAQAAFRASQSDATLTDASFIRLKNFSVSYQLPQLAKKLGAQSLSIYAQGQNVLTFTPYKSADPETQNLILLPPLRLFAFGIKTSF